jgi:hypothetical protein
MQVHATILNAASTAPGRARPRFKFRRRTSPSRVTTTTTTLAQPAAEPYRDSNHCDGMVTVTVVRACQPAAGPRTPSRPGPGLSRCQSPSTVTGTSFFHSTAAMVPQFKSLLRPGFSVCSLAGRRPTSTQVTPSHLLERRRRAAAAAGGGRRPGGGPELSGSSHGLESERGPSYVASFDSRPMVETKSLLPSPSQVSNPAEASHCTPAAGCPESRASPQPG